MEQYQLNDGFDEVCFVLLRFFDGALRIIPPIPATTIAIVSSALLVSDDESTD